MSDVPPSIYTRSRREKTKCQVQVEMKNTASVPKCHCQLCKKDSLNFGLIDGELVLSDEAEMHTSPDKKTEEDKQFDEKFHPDTVWWMDMDAMTLSELLLGATVRECLKQNFQHTCALRGEIMDNYRIRGKKHLCKCKLCAFHPDFPKPTKYHDKEENLIVEPPSSPSSNAGKKSDKVTVEVHPFPPDIEEEETKGDMFLGFLAISAYQRISVSVYR